MTDGMSPKRVLFKGAAWTVGLRWSIRAIGFISTMVMARLLMPADYGIVAMAYLVVGTIQVFVENGPSVALLRKSQVTTGEINSAWTLRLIQCFAAAIVLALAAPLAAHYFQEPKVLGVIWVLTAGILMIGIGNIGTTLAQKEFNFSIEFKLGIISKILSVVVAIAAGYFLRDYRALVLGILSGFISGAFLSYALHPYRPKWDTQDIRKIWDVSKWLTLSGVAGFVLGKTDELVAAKIGTAAEYGLYNVGADLGQMPTAEIGPAMLKALLPVLAALRGSVAEVNASVLKAVAALCAITMPVGVGFAAISTTVTALILGPVWAGAASFVAAYAIASTLGGALSPLSSLLMMRGFVKIQSHIVFIELGAFIVLSFVLVPRYHLMGLAWARVLSIAIRQIAVLLSARRSCGVSIRATIGVTGRPAVGALMMYFFVEWVISYFDVLIVQLFVGVLTGTVIYAAFMWATWLAVGRPPGLESTMMEVLPRLTQRFSRRH